VTTPPASSHRRHRPASRLQRAAWHHPEWTVALVALACWASLATPQLARSATPGGHDPGRASTSGGDPAMHHATPQPGDPTPAHAAIQPTMAHPAVQTGGWLAAQGSWLLMAAAMMLPLALPPARHAALNSRWRRRQRASAVFVAAYVTVWLLFGLGAVTAATWVHLPAGTAWPLALTLVVAAGWELTAAKRRCLRACHRTVPLPPDGWKADAACARFGLRYGRSCLGACWALMLPMAIAGHTGLLLMAVLTAIALAEGVLAKGTRLGPAAALVLLTAAAVATAT
jgi:predicted metal-binding membrane protein